jgi:hypothetical protein
MEINRVWAMPSAWTFKIPPIAALLTRYVGDGKNWIDPFAGDNSPAEFTNDIHPDRKAIYHIDSLDFCLGLKGIYQGVLFDPPYSYRQVSEHYKEVGRKATALDTSSNFYNRVMNATADKIIQGGWAICCGWNSGGYGKNRGYSLEEVLLVCHGGHHNDTIVTVERKL